MMKSMTGYGRAEATQSGCKVAVEISSVNRKQSEVFINLPRELDVLEAKVRDEINRSVGRGKVSCKILLNAGGTNAVTSVQVNTALAKAYYKDFERLAKTLNVSRPVSLDQILRAPGVLETADDYSDPEKFWSTIQKALKKALKELVGMRSREGSHLAKDLSQRIDLMKKAVLRVKKQSPKVLKNYREQLQKRIENAGVKLTNEDQDRLVKEIVIFTDRSDISEELARLESHFKQYQHFAVSKEPVGRTLDFLAQEMNREINTIGSKANDATIAGEVVILKTELEKFREQTQNVE